MTIEIPKNIESFLTRQKGTNIQVNINFVDAINGYGGVIKKSVSLMMLEKRCIRCGYSTIFADKDDDLRRCTRHTYDTKYVSVFDWIEHRRPEEGKSLEECFDEWEKKQSTWDGYIYGAYIEPTKDEAEVADV